MNCVNLMGRLTADPELRQSAAGHYVATFTIAVNRRFKKDTADFIRCTAWRNTAEFISRYFKKGDMIAVVGNIQTGSYEKEGKKYYTTDVIVNEVYFTGGKSQNANSQAAPPEEYDEFADIPGEDNNNPFRVR